MVSVFDNPLGPQVSIDQRSINSVEVCWLIFITLIVMARWGVLKKASWLKNSFGVLGFCGFKW